MRKTGLSIEGYIFSLLFGKLSISGVIYRAGTRPTDSHLEDVVVSHLSGRDGWDGFSQVGIVVVNVYVPDIPNHDSYLVRDVSRLEHLSQQLLTIVESHPTGDYLLETDGTATIEQDTGCHFISMRIKYRYNHIKE